MNSNDKKNGQFIILFDAPIGYGKSYVSKMLSEQMDNVLILSNDKFRRAFCDYGDERRNIWQPLVDEYIRKVLAAGYSIIMDANAANNFAKKKEFYDSLGVPSYIIRLTCPENILDQRLKDRDYTSPNATSFINYTDAKAINAKNAADSKNHIPDGQIFFTIDTSGDVEKQVSELVERLAALG